MNNRAQFREAYHEAGHALVALDQEFTIKFVDMDFEDKGVRKPTCRLVPVERPSYPDLPQLYEFFERYCLWSAGGDAAARIFDNPNLTTSNGMIGAADGGTDDFLDLNDVRVAYRKDVASFRADYPHQSIPPKLVNLPAWEPYLEQAWAILNAQKVCLEKLALEIHKERKMSGEQINVFLASENCKP